MARKPRITAVPVEQVQPEEGLMVARDVPDEKTDAEQMTEIIQEVKEEPNAEEQKEAVSDTHVVAKPKAKRASRAKPKEEPVKEAEKEEPKKEELKEEPKGEDKVECSDCGKQMSAKTLKYSHGPNCSSKKQKKGDDEFAKTLRTAKQVAHEIGGEHGASALDAFTMLESLDKVPDHVIERHIRTRQRAERATRRETMMNNLMQTAF
jgi:hypothetical protein